ncbi:MAG: hypothetical protein GY719_23165 [bacterium]|nr:hypothetical protein [bacterium]
MNGYEILLVGLGGLSSQFDSSNPANDLNHWGSVASIAGLAVAIIGFVVTIWRVLRTQRAAEMVQQAVKVTLKRVGQQLFESKLSASNTLAQSILTLCKSFDWQRAIGRCADLDRHLRELMSSGNLTPREHGDVAGAIDDLSIIREAVEGRIDMESKTPLPLRQRRTLQGVSTLLTKIEIRIASSRREI